MAGLRLAFVFAISIAGVARAEEPRSVAVLEIEAKVGIDQARTDVFADLLQEDLRNRLGFRVIGRADIEAMLGLEKMKDALGCDEASCFAEIGGALGVDEIIAGNLSVLGSHFTISLRRIDPSAATVLGQVAYKVKSATEDDLVASVVPVVDQLYGRAERTGTVAGGASGHAQRPAPPARSGGNVGIFSLGIVGLDPALMQTAIDALGTAVGEAGYQVVTRNELQAMIGAESLKQLAGCDDTSCLAEIGMAAGVERLVSGSLSKVEDRVVVSLQLVNTMGATVENRVTLNWSGPVGEVTEVLGAGAELLLVPAEQREPGSLKLDGIPASAVVSLDGKAIGTGPLTMVGLAIGPHDVRVEAEGFIPSTRHFVVRNDEQTRVTIELTEKEGKPFYAAWWFWAGTGTAVAAGVVAAILLAGGGNETTPPGSSGLTITTTAP